ncbi:MAG: serine hydrolase [Candidatus Saccharibacteria bacterium]
MNRVRNFASDIRFWTKRNRVLLRGCSRLIGALVVLVILAQLVYPHTRALPGVRVAGLPVGGGSSQTIQKQINTAYKDARLTIKTDNTSVTSTFDEIGISPDTKQAVQAALHYSWIERLVPFSSLFISGRNTPMQVIYDDDRLTYFAQQTSKSTYVAAVNASVAIKDSKVVLVPSSPGKVYSAQTIVTAIKKTTHTPKTNITIKPVLQPADRTDSEVRSVLNQAQKAVDASITLTFDDEHATIPKTDVASWLNFTEDTKTQALQLGLKNDLVQKYLASIQGKVYRAPGTTVVQLLDGREVGRTIGATGQGIDVDKTVALITDALRAGKDSTIAVSVTTLQPTVRYNRQYSKTSAGLAALLNTLSAGNGFGISVADLGGTGASASVNGDAKFEAGSTYKLFVAYAVFQQIDAGTMHWTDTFNNESASDCFDAMIVKSDNNCATAFGQAIGWSNIDNMIHAIGFNSTTLSTSTKYTTANDLSKYLQQLQAGTLLDADDTNRLVGDMKIQIYRSGIPAGTGQTVADKVGFVDNVIHDAGIVYGPKGPYVLVVMTSNSSWGAIANVAAQVEAFLEQ